VLDTALGFTAGVMIAASFWSLLAPAIELSEGKGHPAWFPPLVGFALGVLFLRLVDIILPHLHAGYIAEDAEGIKTSWKGTTLLVLRLLAPNSGLIG
jgi:ZIP family zinc transporter